MTLPWRVEARLRCMDLAMRFGYRPDPGDREKGFADAVEALYAAALDVGDDNGAGNPAGSADTGTDQR